MDDTFQNGAAAPSTPLGQNDLHVHEDYSTGINNSGSSPFGGAVQNPSATYQAGHITSPSVASSTPATVATTTTPGSATIQCQECGRTFKRPCDLNRHHRVHTRPEKCPVATCEFHERGFPTTQELFRHIGDRHLEHPVLYYCLYEDCPYSSRRQSNCKQHMEKSHGWVYDRSRPHARAHHGGNGSNHGARGTSIASNIPTPASFAAQAPSISVTPATQLLDALSPFPEPLTPAHLGEGLMFPPLYPPGTEPNQSNQAQLPRQPSADRAASVPASIPPASANSYVPWESPATHQADLEADLNNMIRSLPSHIGSQQPQQPQLPPQQQPHPHHLQQMSAYPPPPSSNNDNGSTCGTLAPAFQYPLSIPNINCASSPYPGDTAYTPIATPQSAPPAIPVNWLPTREFTAQTLAAEATAMLQAVTAAATPASLYSDVMDARGNGSGSDIINLAGHNDMLAAAAGAAVTTMPATPQTTAAPTPYLAPNNNLVNTGGMGNNQTVGPVPHGCASFGSMPVLGVKRDHDAMDGGDSEDGNGSDSSDDDEVDNGSDAGRPRKQRRREAVPDDMNEDEMLCPFHVVDPAFFSVSNQERFSPCHTEHKYISTLFRHLARAAHNMTSKPQSADSFGCSEPLNPQPRAGLCKNCWRSFTDQAAFVSHTASNNCRKVSRSKREKYAIIMETFCARRGDDGESASVAAASALQSPALIRRNTRPEGGGTAAAGPAAATVPPSPYTPQTPSTANNNALSIFPPPPHPPSLPLTAPSTAARAPYSIVSPHGLPLESPPFVTHERHAVLESRVDVLEQIMRSVQAQPLSPQNLVSLFAVSSVSGPANEVGSLVGGMDRQTAVDDDDNDDDDAEENGNEPEVEAAASTTATGHPQRNPLQILPRIRGPRRTESGLSSRSNASSVQHAPTPANLRDQARKPPPPPPQSHQEQENLHGLPYRAGTETVADSGYGTGRGADLGEFDSGDGSFAPGFHDGQGPAHAVTTNHSGNNSNSNSQTLLVDDGVQEPRMFDSDMRNDYLDGGEFSWYP